jgi:hypothetical protein
LTILSKERPILEKLKDAPYYSFRFLPGKENLGYSFSELRAMIENNSVHLRGWDLPHYDRNTVANAQEYIYNTVDWERHLEFWRFYQSGQFIYFSKFWDLSMDLQERLRDEFDRTVRRTSPEEKKNVVGVASFIGVIYSVTEIFVFSARLAKALDIVDFSIYAALHNVENWALVSGEHAAPLHDLYQSHINKITIPNYESIKIIEDPVAIAAQALSEIFQRFQWDNAQGAIQHWQEKFMSGRFAF